MTLSTPFSPALIANYVYELTKEYNQFYQEVPVLREENLEKLRFRLAKRSTSSSTTAIQKKAI